LLPDLFRARFRFFVLAAAASLSEDLELESVVINAGLLRCDAMIDAVGSANGPVTSETEWSVS
jgi:hypothetical protein